MEWAFWRRIIAFVYTLILLLFIGIGFCYSNDTSDEYRENSVLFSDYWKVDGKIITFPYKNDAPFTMTNTLPTVYGDQFFVLRCYYDTFTVRVNGEVILENRDNTFFGVRTTVGQKEIWIPLKASYSGADISIDITMQKSLYGSEITEGFITTRSAYGINALKANVLAVILFVVFTITGILEIFISGFYIAKRAYLIRKLSFEALFYAGMFSIISAQWIINDTRLPAIIFGHMTGFSILNIIAFLLMPLLFFELTRAVFLRVRKVDNAIDGVLALMVVVSCVLATVGIIDWGSVVYVAHVIDVVVIIVVSYYSFNSLKANHKLNIRTGIALANGAFILVAAIALIRYIQSVDNNYLVLIVIDLMIYVMVQVGLIYRRIGLNVKEEKEFAQAKVYAFTDELTNLGNRRHFDGVMEDYEKHKLPPDLTYVAIDVNGLKEVNDTKGHEAGDELLIGTAECLKRAFYNSNTAIIARMGGDEFAVLFLAGPAEINRRLNNFKYYLSKYRGKYINGISVAIGYTTVGENPELSLVDIGNIADERMYKDKNDYYLKIGSKPITS